MTVPHERHVLAAKGISLHRSTHPAENQWKDKARDNAAAAAGQQSLRYGWVQVTGQACATAAEVARVLRLHGWDGRPRPCSPTCPVQRQ